MSKIYAPLLIIFFISFYAQSQQLAPSILWQKSIGGSGTDQARDMIKAIDNGFVVVGHTTSNDGDVSGNHGSSDGWVVKLSPEGNIEWQKTIGGSAGDIFNSIIVTKDGGYLCMGTTNSNDGDVTGNHGGGDIFLVKLDRYGTILWTKSLGGTAGEEAGNIRLNKDGTFFLIGSTRSNNGDVSGNHLSGGSPTKDIWVVRLSATGTILWQRCFGGTFPDTGHDILESLSGNHYYLAIDNLSDDGDFGSSGANSPRGTLVKIRASDNTMVWKTTGSNRDDFTQIMPSGNLNGTDSFFIGHQITVCAPVNNTNGMGFSYHEDRGATINSVSGGNGFGSCGLGYLNNAPHGLNLQSPNNILFVGGSNDSVFTPGFHGQTDGWLIGYSSPTNIAWKKFLGGSRTEFLTSSVILNDFEYVVAGYSNSNDGDVSGNHGNNDDFWIVKLGKLNNIKGSVFADYNLNGIKDASEPLVNNILVESSKGNIRNAASTYGGLFRNAADTGTYRTKTISNLPYYTSTPSSVTSNFSSYYNTDSFSFALQPIPGKRDYRIDFNALTGVRPGFHVTYKILCLNVGTDTLINRSIKFVKDSRLQFLSSVPVATTVVADTITWNIPLLAPRDTVSVLIEMNAAAPPALNFSDTVQSWASIDSTGDLTPLNNKTTLIQRVTGAYDPNDKQESGGGILSRENYNSGQSLNYTIRFQNTGNDTAFNIVVRDTLSARFDVNSFEMLSASHPYQLTIKDGKYCTWTFSNILLPDSNRNEPRSHGYINYRINPTAGLSDGDTIRNRASIYFDFNLPVATNIHETILAPGPVTLPPQPVVSGILNSYCSTQGIQKGKVENLPANGSGITVTVKLDTVSLAVAADSTFSFDVATLSAGPHTITVVFTNNDGSRTTTNNFTSSIAVTPNVNVSANITTIVNADPILVTATNAAGGGASPLYTFAKDRTFTTVIQAEGSSNTAPIDPATLVEGANWIYVRMKTSATCYTVQTNIDSIKLTKVLPPAQPTLSGLLAEYCNTDGTQFGKITNLPASGSGTTVEVKLDASLLTVAADSTFSFPAYALSTGAHAINVKFSNAAGSKTTTHNFTVSAAIFPDVNVSSNITQIVNLTTPVVVTAVSAAGGGSGPLYTFGKDRNFAAVWQAEGPGNTLTLTPSSLTVGDNWIYVQMKSNANCLTMQVAIDSIKLVRDMSTGITDPDNPGKVISLYPNPFNKQVFIKGLSAAKSYTITITNLNGQLIQQSKVSNRTNAELLLQINKAGTYLLSIYDEKKKSLLGTIKIIKH